MLQQKKTSHTKEGNSEEMDGPLPKIAVFQKTKLHTGVNWPLFDKLQILAASSRAQKKKSTELSTRV